MRKDCDKKDANLKRCNCTYEPCPRKGFCCDCLDYHLKARQLPACCFPADVEATWDRSFSRFVKCVQDGAI